MGWNEFWDWKFSDSDESFYEHLEKEYGEDAPILHAILDTAVDSAVGAIPVAGQIYTIANARNPEIKEAKDAIWEERHEILAVGSAVPVVGTAVSAIDATLHAAESVENNVEFFIEGATGEDEPIYDENGNVIGWKDKWETDKMKRKANYATTHGVNATVGAVLTVTGANYFKGGKAAVTAAQKGGGNLIERLFVKNVDNAVDSVAENATKRAAADATFHESANAARTASAQARQAAVKEGEEAALAWEANNAAKKATTNAAIEAAEQQAKNHTVYAGLERSIKEQAERDAQAAMERAAKAAAERDAAKLAEDAARQQWERGMRAIDFLQSSNNIRSFLATSVTIGMAVVSDQPQDNMCTDTK